MFFCFFYQGNCFSRVFFPTTSRCFLVDLSPFLMIFGRSLVFFLNSNKTLSKKSFMWGIKKALNEDAKKWQWRNTEWSHTHPKITRNDKKYVHLRHFFLHRSQKKEDFVLFSWGNHDGTNSKFCMPSLLAGHIEFDAFFCGLFSKNTHIFCIQCFFWRSWHGLLAQSLNSKFKNYPFWGSRMACKHTITHSLIDQMGFWQVSNWTFKEKSLCIIAHVLFRQICVGGSDGMCFRTIVFFPSFVCPSNCFPAFFSQ